MPTLEDAKTHIIKLILAIDDVDEHEKIHSFVHSLEAICHCINSEKAFLPFQHPMRAEPDDHFPTDLE